MKLSLYYPVKPLFITQKFGETANLAYYKANGLTFIGHNGIDFVARHAQPVYAAHDGNCYPEVDDKGGEGVVITTLQTFDYNDGQAYFKSIYWHLIKSDAVVSWGQVVKAGDLIGYADSTGLSTGDHLHFGLKAMLPGEPAGTWYNIEQDNGYMGAIDPQPYFNGQFAEDLKGYTFNETLIWRDSSEDVRQLQLKLKRLGYFPADTEATGYYGLTTRAAVYSFQLAKVPLSPIEKYVYLGMYFGPKSRAVLNAIVL